MRIFVDIDNTICTTGSGEDKYLDSKPIFDRIEMVNQLFDDGNHIVYWTARGSRSGKDYTKLTIEQLDRWDVKRNSVLFGKPDYDIFIDDKSISSESYFGPK